MKVAFLGTGAMGSGIADNILKGGHSLSVWNIKDAFWVNTEALAAKDAKACESIQDAVENAEVIGMSLTSDKIVKLVCNQIYPFVQKGTVIFDCSTTSPGCSKEMQAKFADKGIDFIDAPVSGGIGGAADGTLTIMIGGKEAAFKKAEPVIKCCSAYYTHMGEIGMGQTTKLINQLLTGVNQAAVCEAMLIAERSGLNLVKLYNILITAWGNSKMLERSVMDYIVPKKFESAACLELLVKDLNLTIQMAEDVGFKVPITSMVLQFYQEAKNSGIGREDHSAIIKIMEKENKK